MDYDVCTYIDRLDSFYINGEQDPGTQTSGTLMLEGIEVSWVIGLGDDKWYMPADPEVPRPEDSPDAGWAGEVGFDLLIKSPYANERNPAALKETKSTLEDLLGYMRKSAERLSFDGVFLGVHRFRHEDNVSAPSKSTQENNLDLTEV